MNIHEFHTKVRAKLEANRNTDFDILELYDAAAAETLSEGLAEAVTDLRYSLPKLAAWLSESKSSDR